MDWIRNAINETCQQITKWELELVDGKQPRGFYEQKDVVNAIFAKHQPPVPKSVAELAEKIFDEIVVGRETKEDPVATTDKTAQLLTSFLNSRIEGAAKALATQLNPNSANCHREVAQTLKQSFGIGE